ncbi:hypothetical protein GUJ93_ZPchr0010g9347 [Zizania palustris]|uniref:DUF834 domain-containing protein n=1 Tax=Zizania palustris TaxID=103762 RepID=A0A8J5WGJ8_ZIZPA|nr:hypothetical protein GUJ93_ZPchr0010g9347 [Zizania palustris]
MATREELRRGLEAAPMGSRMVVGQHRPMRSKVKVMVVAGEVGDGGSGLEAVGFKGSGAASMGRGRRRRPTGSRAEAVVAGPVGRVRSGMEGGISDEICELEPA